MAKHGAEWELAFAFEVELRAGAITLAEVLFRPVLAAAGSRVAAAASAAG
jgi:hypothetical protein